MNARAARAEAAPACPMGHGAEPGAPATPALAEAPDAAIGAAIADMVAATDYPCVGAKSVFNRDRVRLLVLDRLADPGETGRLHRELVRFMAGHPREVGTAAGNPRLASFVAAFREPVPATEADFEDLLWRQLALLHELDGADWDEQVSPDPAHPHFGFSVAGRACFVIGMHPGASRLARRSPLPVLVFNLHSQFEQLRVSGRYDRLRDTVRRRDAALQGDINPMVADHGVRSEARQYSGRQVPDGWLPPYDLGAGQPEGDQ